MGAGKYLAYLKHQLNPAESMNAESYFMELLLRFIVTGTSPEFSHLRSLANADGDTKAVEFFDDILDKGPKVATKSYVDSSILSGSLDPTQTALSAPMGTLYSSEVAPFGVYQKLDDGETTNWLLIAGGSMESVTIAGRTFTQNLDKLKIFGFVCAATGTSNASSLSLISTPTVGYQVPVGKKLVIVGAVGDGSVAGINGIGYADNDVGVRADPAALTNPVPTPADIANGAYWISLPSPATPGEQAVQTLINLTVPAGKYPFALGWGSNNEITGQVFAFELDI